MSTQRPHHRDVFAMVRQACIRSLSCEVTVYDYFFESGMSNIISIVPDMFFIPPANFVCGGYTVFTLSVCVSVRVSICVSVRDAGFFLIHVS